MKWIVILSVCFTTVLFGQRTIAFRDGKQLSIPVSSIVEFQEYDTDLSPLKRVYTHYLFQNDSIYIWKYSEWNKGMMDELKTYVFHPNQLSEYFSEPSENEVDEFHPNVYYSLSISTDAEVGFKYATYNVYSSVPELRTFSVFGVEADKREDLVTLYELIKSKLPKANSEE